MSDWPGSNVAGRKFRYEWRRTFSGSHHDFAAWDGSEQIGRIYRDAAHVTPGMWFWTMLANIQGSSGVNCSGHLPGKDAAATQVESIYTVLKARAEAEGWPPEPQPHGPGTEVVKGKGPAYPCEYPSYQQQKRRRRKYKKGPAA